MNIPCNNPCVVCDPIPVGADGIFPNPNAEANPFSNFSSEAPDKPIFTGRNYPDGWTGDPPTLGNHPFTATGCIGLCFSDVSQEEADICAFNQKIICDLINNPNDPTGVDPAFCVLFPREEQCLPLYKQPVYNDAQSCTVTCPDGTPFTFIIAAQRFLSPTKAQANAIAYSYACNKAIQNRVCMSALSPSTCCEGSNYNGGIVVSYAQPSPLPFTFTVSSGSLPPGLTLAATGNVTASITGIPTSTGTYTFSITATHPSGVGMTKEYIISVVGITQTSLPDGEVGTAYSETLTVQGPTSGPIAWTFISGALPDGLTFNTSTGEISGTPTVDASFHFIVGFSDSNISCARDFTMTVNAAATCPDWTQLLWDVPNIFTAGAGTAVFAPDSVVSDSFITSTSAPDGGNVDNGSASNTANMTYNGPGCNCNLHVDLQKGLSTASVCGGVAILADGNMVLQFQAGGAPDGTNPTGIYDIPFVLPDTLGLPIPIFVQVTSQSICGGLPDDTPMLSMIGQITNLP